MINIPISYNPDVASGHRAKGTLSSGSSPSSILGGIPPPYPWEAVASIRAVLALCESAFCVWGDFLSGEWRFPEVGKIGDEWDGDADCLSLC